MDLFRDSDVVNSLLKTNWGGGGGGGGARDRRLNFVRRQLFYNFVRYQT